MTPRLIIEQKITAFTNQYRIFESDANGEKQGVFGFAQQKRIALKEKVTFYKDETKNHEAFTFRAEKVLDVHGRYFVEDGNGQVIGMFRKVFGKSLLNSTWRLMDKDGNELIEVSENSMFLAFIRRFGGWIPVVGDIIDIVVMFLRYHFKFVDLKSGEEVGTYQKTTLFRDHYRLSLADNATGAVDTRVYAAFGVALDALQSR